MKSDNLYSQILDTQDNLKKSTTSRNLYAAAATVCSTMSIFALSQLGQANYLAASLGTGSLLVTGATISFCKFNKKIDDIRSSRLQLVNLRREYEHQMLVESQEYHKRIRSKKAA